jgi:hypothetical protein
MASSAFHPPGWRWSPWPLAQENAWPDPSASAHPTRARPCNPVHCSPDFDAAAPRQPCPWTAQRQGRPLSSAAPGFPRRRSIHATAVRPAADGCARRRGRVVSVGSSWWGQDAPTLGRGRDAPLSAGGGTPPLREAACLAVISRHRSSGVAPLRALCALCDGRPEPRLCRVSARPCRTRSDPSPWTRSIPETSNGVASPVPTSQFPLLDDRVVAQAHAFIRLGGGLVALSGFREILQPVGEFLSGGELRRTVRCFAGNGAADVGYEDLREAATQCAVGETGDVIALFQMDAAGSSKWSLALMCRSSSANTASRA